MNPMGFFKEAIQELKKAAWLPRQQAVGSTIAVIILVALLAAYAGAIDFVLSILLGALLGRS